MRKGCLLTWLAFSLINLHLQTNFFVDLPLKLEPASLSYIHCLVNARFLSPIILSIGVLVYLDTLIFFRSETALQPRAEILHSINHITRRKLNILSPIDHRLSGIEDRVVASSPSYPDKHYSVGGKTNPKEAMMKAKSSWMRHRLISWLFLQASSIASGIAVTHWSCVWGARKSPCSNGHPHPAISRVLHIYQSSSCGESLDWESNWQVPSISFPTLSN